MPLIGIAGDVVEPRPGSVRSQCGITYALAVWRAGGMPVILPPLVEIIPEVLRQCDGFVLTGGDDPRTEPFGEPTHPKAEPVHPVRQAFDTALLGALMHRPETPALGVCLGMQMMALVGGGKLNQHLPDTLPSAGEHWNNGKHRVVPVVGDAGRLGIAEGLVTSHHRQAVSESGRLRVCAMSEDGVTEAIELPGARFFLGVQWHPERTEHGTLGPGLFERLVAAARER